MKTICIPAILAVLLLSPNPGLYAQNDAASAHAAPLQEPVKILYLNNTARTEDAGDLLTALRNVLAPQNKIYFVQSRNAIVMSGTPDQIELAQKVLAGLDIPKKLYKLTFTVGESDGGKRIGVQHFDLVIAGGGRTTLKQGNKVPVVTGDYVAGSNSTQTQVTYIDVGLNFDASLDESANGVRLRCKVERSSVAEPIAGPPHTAEDPVIRQTVLEGTSTLAVGKPLLLGALDVPDSTRHLDIEVVMDIVH